MILSRKDVEDLRCDPLDTTGTDMRDTALLAHDFADVVRGELDALAEAVAIYDRAALEEYVTKLREVLAEFDKGTEKDNER